MNAALGETTFHLDGRKLSVAFASIGFSEQQHGGEPFSPPSAEILKPAQRRVSGIGKWWGESSKGCYSPARRRHSALSCGPTK